jgi:cellulose synthase operon protein C
VPAAASPEVAFGIEWMEAVLAQRRGQRAEAVRRFVALGLAPALWLEAEGTKLRADALGPEGRIRAGMWTGSDEILAKARLDFGSGRRLVLRVAAGGPWRLLIDGREVMSGEAGEMEASRLRLRGRGEHELELRFTVERHGAVWLRATDPAGRPAPEAWATDSSSSETGPAPSPLHVEATPEANPPSIALHALLAEGARRGPEAAVRGLAELTRREPRNAAAWAWLSRWEPRRRVEAAKRAVALAPGDPASWVTLAHACGDLRWPCAGEALARAQALDPTDPELRRENAAFAFDRRDAGLEALRRLDPTRPLEAAERARMWERLGRPERALVEARYALSALPMRTDLRALIMRIEAEAGRPEVVLRQATSARALAPDLPRWWFATARWMRAVDASAAKVALARTRSRFPLHAEPLLIEAEWAMMEGRPVAALLELALALEPERTELRDWAALSSRARRPLPPLPPISTAELRAGGAVLLDRRRFTVEAGAWSRVQERILRVQDPAKAGVAAESSIAYAPARERLEIVDAVLMRRDGTRLPPAAILDEGQDQPVDGMYVDTRHRIIRFDGLEPGDLVRIETRSESRGRDMFGGFVGSVEAVQGLWPVAEARVELVHPEGRPMKAYARGLQEGPPRIDAGQVHRKWTVRDLPPLPREPLGPAYIDFGPFVSTSSYEKWSEMAQWYAELVRPQRRLGPDARAAGRRATEGLQDQRDIVDRLFRLTVDEIRYVGIELGIHGWKPHEASEVFRRGYGDCKDKATLLSAWLADHGIASSLVLVRTADRGVFPEDAPTMWAFNHALLYVPSLDRFLDPTADFVSANELPTLDQGAMGLVVPLEGTGRLLRLPMSEAEDNFNEGRVTVFVSAAGGIRIEGRERFRGAPASHARREFEDEGRRFERLQRQLSALFPGLELTRARFEDLPEAFVYDYGAEVGGHGRREGRTLHLPSSLYRHELTDAYAGPSERSTDLVLDFPWHTRNVVRYRLPPGSRVRALPPPIEVTGPNLFFTQSFEATADGFRVVDEVVMSERRLRAVDYERFRRACRAADEAMLREIEVELP